MSEDLNQLLSEGSINVGDTLTGVVKSIDANGATVTLGKGFEGHIPVKELSVLALDTAEGIVNVGDQIVAVVTSLDMESGTVSLSKRQATNKDAWSQMKTYHETQEPFDIVIHDVVKGGLVTDVGIRGFVPASLVDRKFVEDLNTFKGTTMKVQVAEIDQENNKLILSRRAVMDSAQKAQAFEFLKTIHEGDVLDGVVQRLTNFGAFVDIGGSEGLVHVSELSWSHVNHPSDVVKEGDKVKVRVLRVSPEEGKISLSIKGATNGPWQEHASTLVAGETVRGVVKRVVDFGAFVELAPGLEGLVHVSQLSNDHVANPSDVVSTGQEVEVKILSVEPDKKRISLSMRDDSSPAAGPRTNAKSQKASGGQQKPRRESKSRGPAVNIPEPMVGTGATLGDLFGDLFKDNSK